MGAHRDETQPMKSLEESILENIDKAAASVQEPVKKVVSDAITAKRLAYFMIFTFMVFAIAVTWAFIKIADLSEQNKQYLEASCQGGNADRALELGFWMGILDERAKDKKNRTPEAQANLEAYRTQFKDAYPQIDCSKVGSGERVELPQ